MEGNSIVPVMEVNKQNAMPYDCGMMGGGYMWFMWVIILFFFMGNNGWNNNNQALTAQDIFLNGNATRNEVYNGFNNQTLQGDLRTLQGEVCNGFNGVQRDISHNAFGLQHTLDNGFSGVNANIAENRFASQQCCCETQRAIDAVRAENYRNTCEITTAIRADGEATRALYVQQQMQNLRDRLADRDRDLQTAQMEATMLGYTRDVVHALRPYPQPAYITSSPYQSINPCGGCNNCYNA